jgi:hypothetical protein
LNHKTANTGSTVLEMMTVTLTGLCHTFAPTNSAILISLFGMWPPYTGCASVTRYEFSTLKVTTL